MFSLLYHNRHEKDKGFLTSAVETRRVDIAAVTIKITRSEMKSLRVFQGNGLQSMAFAVRIPASCPRPPRIPAVRPSIWPYRSVRRSGMDRATGEPVLSERLPFCPAVRCPLKDGNRPECPAAAAGRRRLRVSSASQVMVGVPLFRMLRLRAIAAAGNMFPECSGMVTYANWYAAVICWGFRE